MLILIHTHGQLTVRSRSGLGSEFTLRHSTEVQNLTNSDLAIIPLVFGRYSPEEPHRLYVT